MSESLEIQDLRAGYDGSIVVDGISVEIPRGKVVAMLGRNGVGKSTFAAAVSGTLPTASGSVTVGGSPITGLRPSRRYARGLRIVRQDRAVLGALTVADNLRLVGAEVAAAAELFPFLTGRDGQRAGTLSGGEQKMLAVARQALNPGSFWILDEPTEGLQPRNVDRVREIVAAAAENGVGVLLIEQHLVMALDVADQWLLVEKGRVVDRGAVTASTQDLVSRALVI